MNAIANILTQTNLDSAVSYSGQIITLAKQVRCVSGEAVAHQTKAEALIRKSQFTNARTELMLAEGLARTLRDSMPVAHVYSVYGMFYGMQSK